MPHRNSVRPESLNLTPKQTFGPYQGKISVHIMEGENVTDNSRSMAVRMVQITPRTYETYDNGFGISEEYQSSFYRVDDIPALILALQEALAFAYHNPIRGDGSTDSNIYR